MGKFDGILICTDMDGTLLNSKSQVSEENRKAIEYFMSEGGLFTFVTGRAISAVDMFYEQLHPNMPVAVYNGSAVYDMDKREFLSCTYLDKDAKELIELIDKNFKEFVYAVYTDTETCFGDKNKWYDMYFHFTNNETICVKPYWEADKDWFKIVFVSSEEEILDVRKCLENSGLDDKYDFIQSGEAFFEALPKGASKGNAIRKIREMSKHKIDKVVAIGDSENDISSITYADIGVAVANAMDTVKEAADYVTVSNNEHAVKAVIEYLEKNLENTGE